MLVARATEAVGNLVEHRRRVVPAVGVRDEGHRARLLPHGHLAVAHVRAAPGEMREVAQTTTGRDVVVPVDDRDRLVSAKDDVVRSEVAVTDDLVPGRQRRARGRIVEAANERSGSDRTLVGQPNRRPRNHRSRDVAEDLAALVVDPPQPRRTVEADGLEVPEDRVDVPRPRVERASDGIGDAHDPLGLAATLEGDLGGSAHPATVAHAASQAIARRERTASTYPRVMAIKLHRCPKTWMRLGLEPCWKVQRELDRKGIPYELVIGPHRRGHRDGLEHLSGQRLYPVIEFDDATTYRAESSEMAARVSSGTLGTTA